MAADAAPARLDAWLAGQLADLGRNRAKQLILDGRVAIGGRTIVEAKKGGQTGRKRHRRPAAASSGGAGG